MTKFVIRRSTASSCSRVSPLSQANERARIVVDVGFQPKADIADRLWFLQGNPFTGGPKTSRRRFAVSHRLPHNSRGRGKQAAGKKRMPMELAILHILHDAVEAHLPSIIDDDRRQTALTYLRGLDVALAARPSESKTSNIVALRNQDTKSRLHRVISDYRQSAIADARRLHQQGFHELGWDVRNEID